MKLDNCAEAEPKPMRTLNWTHAVREIALQPLDATREADQVERAAVAAHLDLLSCETFKVDYHVRSLDHGRAALSGHLEADITQACVVTLEPIASKISGTFALELWPAGDLPAVGEHAVDDLADEPEAIENGIIDVGRIALECLADLVDPYPRKPGADFSWTDAKAAAAGSDNPFAKLKNLGRSS
jgi:uncharacterized metal-binding protein YceD (DUF177 family)